MRDPRNGDLWVARTDSPHFFLQGRLTRTIYCIVGPGSICSSSRKYSRVLALRQHGDLDVLEMSHEHLKSFYEPLPRP